MKIACCLFGHVGGKSGRDGFGGWLDPMHSLQNYKQYLFQNLDVDFFVHCWSPEYRNKIEQFLSPKRSLFEKQKDFSSTHLDEYKLSMINDYRGIIDTQDNPERYLTELARRARSRWLSTSSVLTYCVEHSLHTGVAYDAIILLRFDLHFYRKINIEVVNENTLYTSLRKKDKETTVEDLILYGRPEVLNKLIDIHENHSNYSIRPPTAIHQIAQKNKLVINDNIIRGRDFDLVRESTINSNSTKIQKLRKKIKMIFT